MDWERFERAVALRNAGKEEEALQEFESLASLAEDSHEKGSLIGNQVTCLWRLGRLSEARQRLAEAKALWANFYFEFLDATLCAAEGEKDEALGKLRLFLSKHSDLRKSADRGIYVNAQEELGLLLFGLGRYADAAKPLEEALEFAEGDQRKRLCFYRGICHIEDGDLESAEESFLASLPSDRGDPLWAKAQFYLGCLFFWKGAYLKAKNAFEISEHFMESSDAALKEGISSWLTATRLKLGEPEDPRVQ